MGVASVAGSRGLDAQQQRQQQKSRSFYCASVAEAHGYSDASFMVGDGAARDTEELLRTREALAGALPTVRLFPGPELIAARCMACD